MSSGTSFRRWSALTGLIGILSASMAGCGGSGSSSSNSSGGSGSGGSSGIDGSRRTTIDPTLPVCQANPHSSGRARWTILVYLNAANNLQPFSLLNMGQLASVGSDSNVNIVVQWKQVSASQISGCNNCTPSFVGTRRYFVHAHSQANVNAIETNHDTTVLDADRLPDPETNTTNAATGVSTSDMGSYRTLQSFVRWGANAYPADNLALVIWDHGSGWQPAYRSVSQNRLHPRFRAVSQDDGTGNEIETQELALALASPPQPLDMLIFDCSLEGMVEVAYEVRNTARVMVCSEESPPGNGYPYDAWLNDLKASGKNVCDVGTSIVNRFVANYPSESDITQSVLDLSKMQSVASALDSFGSALRSHVNDQANLIRDARNAAQSYAYPDNKDLFDYADLIRGGSGVPSDLQQAAISLQNTLVGTGGAILASSHGNVGQAGSNGLAVFLPDPTSYLASYNDLALSHAAQHWPQFLQAQVK